MIQTPGLEFQFDRTDCHNDLLFCREKTLFGSSGNCVPDEEEKEEGIPST